MSDPVAETDEFYRGSGFSYREDYVSAWLEQHLPLPERGRVLDLCCGDGVWSSGIRRARPHVEVHGFDLSRGGVEKARQLVPDGLFVVADAERELPWRDGSFDVVFARSPSLYNQHDMSRPATVRVIEMWHRKLAPDGRLYSIFFSNPDLAGQYVSDERVKLPFNRTPRRTAAVDFSGGKYHHDDESFRAPFEAAEGVVVESYSWEKRVHLLVSRRG